MKVLQVSPYFYPYVGGQERYVYELSRKLIEYGHEVTIFTSNFPKGKTFEVIDGIRVRRFRIFGRPLRNPIVPSLLFSIIREIEDFDVIHAHNEHGFSTLICTLVKTVKGKKPLIITCHGQLKFNTALKDFIERMYSRSLGVMIFKSADVIIALSPSDKRYILSFGVNEGKVRVIPNAINLQKLLAFKRSDLALFREIGFEGKRLVLFVGPIIKRKGVDVLLKAIPKVVKEHKDVRFVFTGDGDFKEKAFEIAKRENIEDFICFTGRLTEKELYNIYQLSELIVLPSISEGVPTSILEAFAFSKPVVSTKIPGIYDYFNEVAYLINPGSVDELSSAIITLLEDRKLAKCMGEKGRELISKNFTWDTIVMKILEIYREVLTARSFIQ
jgi:glycosyltransferase involved in cell wall biosynthesis